MHNFSFIFSPLPLFLIDANDSVSCLNNFTMICYQKCIIYLRVVKITKSTWSLKKQHLDLLCQQACWLSHSPNYICRAQECPMLFTAHCKASSIKTPVKEAGGACNNGRSSTKLLIYTKHFNKNLW